MARIFIANTNVQPISVIPIRFAQTISSRGFTQEVMSAALVICLLPIAILNQRYAGKIVLSVHRVKENETYIEINLYDNGAGLSDDNYNQLEKMLIELKVDFWSKDDNEDNHIGVMNVQQRLKMYYSSECGLRYYRNEEGGITASILIKDEIDYMT